MEVLTSPGGQLIYRPGQAFPVLFRAAAEMPAVESVEHLFDLLSELQQRIGADWRDDWVLPLWLSLSLFSVEDLANASEDGLSAMLQQLWKHLDFKRGNLGNYEADEQRALSNL